jgi:hypothetical protein
MASLTSGRPRNGRDPTPISSERPVRALAKQTCVRLQPNSNDSSVCWHTCFPRARRTVYWLSSAVAWRLCIAPAASRTSAFADTKEGCPFRSRGRRGRTHCTLGVDGRREGCAVVPSHWACTHPSQLPRGLPPAIAALLASWGRGRRGFHAPSANAASTTRMSMAIAPGSRRPGTLTLQLPSSHTHTSTWITYTHNSHINDRKRIGLWVCLGWKRRGRGTDRTLT